MALDPAAYKAMAVQARRTQQPRTLQDDIDELRVKLAKAERELAAATQHVAALETENDALALKAHRARKVNADPSVTGQFHDGIEYVNQVQAAAILKVKQYAVSRWIKAGKIQTMTVPGHKKPQIVRSSLVKPERGKPGRKKK